ncbi:MAG: 4Fe-4S binding protein [Christensenellaceae bacterium]|jgi:dihydroorotate dehydrogenase (fumarate)|nr:4Fe-4S binding protein [Christensenellaceae bacterium]
MTETKGIDTSIEYCGRRLQSPFILASGPLSYGAQGMIRAHEAGFGAVVTKTIRLQAAVNPVHHIGKVSGDTLINCEKWADFDRLAWYEKEIPEAVRAGATVIGSVGHTPGEAKAIVQDVEKAGAHMIELVSYTEDTLLPMLDYAKAHVRIPVICKLSGNWANPAATARACYEHGADGVAAIDSIGPVLKIDIHNRRPLMMSGDGYGWLTGAAIKPISLRINADIARGVKGYKNLYCIGGVMSAADALEFLMVGSHAVGVCTATILKGIGYVGTLRRQLAELLQTLGFGSLQEAVGAALPNFPQRECVTDLAFSFAPEACTKCGKCALVCPYAARKLEYPTMHLDAALCRSCGLCADYCPTGALSSSCKEPTAAHARLAEASAAFDKMIAGE